MTDALGYSPQQMEIVARELGIVTMNLLLSEQGKTTLIDEIRRRDEHLTLLTNRLTAYEADINRLREEVGAKPIRRRGAK